MSKPSKLELKRARECTRKTKYSSRRKAEMVENVRIVANGWEKGTIYKCSFGGHYHISSRKSLSPAEKIDMLLKQN